MKIIYILLLSLSIFCSSILPNASNLLPTNTIIISDLDDVLIQKSSFLSSLSKLKNFIGDYKKNIDGIKEELQDKKGNKINGLTFHLLYHGMRKPYLTPYTTWMVEHLEISRRLSNDTAKIYRYLKHKGYSIIFATNKDRISYDITAHSIGNKFTSLADKVFVAHPGNSPELISQLQAFANLTTTPKSYKELLQKTLTIQPTKMILHAPSKKPNYEYYHYVEQNLDAHNNMIFIDDQLSNVKGFENLQQNSTVCRIGILYKNPEQLAQEFIDLGILSETDDQKLLEEIRYPGIWGKIKLTAQKLVGKLTKPTLATNT